MRRTVAGCLCALLVGLPAPGLPAPAEPMEDADYVAIVPQTGPPDGRIEVIEFFYYGCAACDRFEPHLQRWLRTLPGDVSFRRVPALRRTDWIPLTRIYFALQQLGVLDRLHTQVYHGFHQSNLNLASERDLLDWGYQHGLDRAAFQQVLHSDGVAAAVQAARDSTVAYGVRATPSLVVDGRYLTSAGMVGSVDALLPVVDALIEKARTMRVRQ